MAEEGEELDPLKAVHISVFGKRHEGKTELAYCLFDTYPFDRAILDPNGNIKLESTEERPVVDIDPGEGIPTRWPAHRFPRALPGQPRKPQTIRLVPDVIRPTWEDDIDRFCGLAYNHGRTMLMVDEAANAVPAGRVPPHSRRNLRQGRHKDLSQIYTDLRPIGVDPLVIANSDFVYVFKLPHPDDRKRVAANIGVKPKIFDEAVDALDEHEYLRFDSARDELLHCPALPPDLIRHHKS